MSNVGVNSHSAADHRARGMRAVEQSTDLVPLSSAQQRLWFMDQLVPNTGLYNLPVVCRLHGMVDKEALGKAFSEVLTRHDALRTTFIHADEGPMQAVSETAASGLKHVDLRQLETADRSKAESRLAREEALMPFNLAEGPLVRASLLQIQNEEWVLVIAMHHIVSDEWSIKVLFHELGLLYQSFLQNTCAALPELPIQYPDYALWQQSWLETARFKEQLEHWKTQLGDCKLATEWPGDRPQPATPSFRGATEELSLPAALAEAVRELARTENATPFMVLLAAYKALLFRYTGQTDMVVGAPISGRTRKEVEPLIGFFVNTLPLRTRLDGGMSFVQLVAKVRETTLGAFAHQDVPFEKIVEALHPDRSIHHTPFTRLMFVMQSPQQFSLPGVRVELEEVPGEWAKFDLTLSVQDSKGGLVTHCEYSTDLYEGATIRRMLGHYGQLLKALVENPRKRIAELPLLTEDERRQAIETWNQTATDFPKDRCVHELFEAQAAAQPNAQALAYAAQSLSYGELNVRANQLAWHLRGMGIKPEVPVAVCMHRSADLIVAILAILKAGGAYVPIDPAYPKERVTLLLKDTAAPILLTQQSLLTDLPCDLCKVLCTDADWSVIAQGSRERPPCLSTADSLAYIMYTSGSTGTPKGVAVTHKGIVRLVRNTNYITFTNKDRVAQVANVAFDASTFEIWGALLNGGCLVGIAQDSALCPRDFASELRRNRISAMFLTTGLFNQVAAEVPGAFQGVDTLIVGGEALDPKWVRAVLESTPPRRLVNGYGPTENTTFTTWHHVQALPANARSVPIGKPIANTTVYVLDEALNPVPVGVPGELYTGGAGLARGYWNGLEMTESRFVPNPFSKDPGAKLYKTGDTVKRLHDGTIEYLGRADGQVKLRGFRIELGEIEAQVKSHPEVKDCAVTVSEGSGGLKRLTAYIVPESGANPGVTQLRSYLAAKMPEYMLPSAFVPLPCLPLTPNGKLDRKALPSPDGVRPELDRKYIEPRTEVEQRLAGILERVLKVSPVGVKDNFFELGGHSLLAIRTVSLIEKEFGRAIRVATLFQAPTVEQLAELLSRSSTEPAPLEKKNSLVEIRGEGKGPSLFLVHGAGGGMFWGYVNLAKHLQGPVYGFKSRGLDGLSEFDKIEELAAQYVTDMQAHQPAGPYYLGGYCFGGNVAFEMARQLEAAGEKVAVLALMNCAPPNSSYTRIPWTPAWGLRLARNMKYWAGYFRSWTPAQRRDFFKWKAKVFYRKLSCWPKAQLARCAPIEASNLVDLSSYTTEQQKVWQAHIRALVNFHPKPLNGKVTLLRSPGHPLWCSFGEDYGWGELAQKGVEIHIVPAAHERILEEPCAKHVGELLQLSIEGMTCKAEVEKASNPTAVLRAVVARATLLWFGAEGGLLEIAAPLEHGTFNLSSVFAHLGVLGTAAVGSAAPQAFRAAGATQPAESQTAMAGAVQTAVIPPDVRKDLESLASANNIPLHAVLLAAAKVLFYRHAVSGGATLVDQTSATVDQERKLTCQVNDLVLRATIDSSMTFLSLLDQLRPFAGNIALDHCTVLSVRVEDASGGQSADDMQFRLLLEGDTASLTLEYNPAYLDSETAARVVSSYETLLEGIASTPSRKIADLPLLRETERRRLANEWIENREEFDLSRSYASVFNNVASVHANRTALLSGNQKLTYAELNERSNQLAHYLVAQGIQSEALVGICLERSPELIIALLAVWKAGAAYVPLDPHYPKERLAFMMQDSDARVILTRRELAGRLGAQAPSMVCLDSEEVKKSIASQPNSNPELSANGNTLAYVMYTSGSTGQPKGVQIEHHSLLNHNFAIATAFELRAEDRVLQFSPISFDISVEEIFPTLLQGARLVLRPEDVTSSTDKFLNFVEQQGVTVLDLPTAFWHELVEAVQRRPLPKSVRCVVIGGEKASESAYDRWRKAVAPSVSLFNTYGPTETTVTATLYKADYSSARLPIGKPLVNTHVVLLDDNLQPVAKGMTGELFIGGEGVARGYLNKPELTAQKFIANPLQEMPGQRLYRTGDLARIAEDGQLEFVGRSDQQVKFRGYRIELGEIEAAIRSHESVKDCVVTVREDQPGRKRLAAYVVPRAIVDTTTHELRAYLRDKLPDYMVPTAFVTLSALPFTPAGKVDRRGLPNPGNARPMLDTPYVAPRTPLETVLSRVWCDVLDLAQVGVNDNFFELGGHSLLAARLTSRIRDAMQLDVMLGDVFDKPTVAELARTITVSSKAPALPWNALIATPPQPLSRAQKRVWFLDQFDPAQSCYNVYQAFRIDGELDYSRLSAALSALVSRHEAARSIFPALQGTPARLVWPGTTVPLNLQDFTCFPEAEREAAALEALAAHACCSHITIAPALRVVVAKMSERSHWLLVVLHELVADTSALKQFCAELFDEYCGKTPKQTVHLEFTEAVQRQIEVENASGSLLEACVQRFKDTAECLEVPADRPRPAYMRDAGGRLPFSVGSGAAQLTEFARKHDVPRELVLQAAFASVLFRYSRTPVFAMGGETRETGASAIAPLTNWVPWRCDFSGEPTFLEICERLKTEKQAVDSYARVPFACVIEHAGVRRNPSHTPLFQVMFRYDDAPFQASEKASMGVLPMDLDNGTAKLDLLMHLNAGEESLRGFIEYSTDLFDASRIQRLAAHFETFLADALSNPARNISSLRIMPDSEMRLLEHWNNTARPYPKDKSLVDLCWEQASRTPDACALVWGTERVSYAELSARADTFARRLAGQGIGKGSLVGICLERAPELLVAILGVLRTGAAYVPLDPRYPHDRLRLVLEDCKARCVVSQENLRETVTGLGDVPAIFVDAPLGKNASAAQLTPPAPDDVAYVIYTSGSTGIPKGVVIEHRSAVALIAWALEEYTPGELSGVLACTSICFDLSIYEMFVPLSCGGTIILADNALALPELAARNEVTLLNTVPSAIQELLRLRAVPENVAVVNLAGEPLTAELSDRIYAETKVRRLFDLYGPTETTTYSTGSLRQPGKPASIGKPLPNEQVWLLDETGALVPVGIPGEVFIGGVGIARGYLNRPDLTAERFINSPLDSAQKLYRTGDLARWREEGTLEYLGRRDFQVKIRGYRIELGEIESAVRKHAAIKDVVVVARADGGAKRLYAYVVAREGYAVSSEDLRTHLKGTLPEHMVPAGFIALPALPLTPNGKVDRKALPEPTVSGDAKVGRTLPRTETERLVAATWKEVLGLREVAVDDNFFELGGDSLLAVRVLSRLRDSLKCEVPLTLLFGRPVLESLACAVEEVRGSSSGDALALQPVPRDQDIPASFVQERLWVLHELSPESDAYNIPAAMRLSGPLNVAALERALEHVVNRHEPLRTTLALKGDQVVQKIHPSLQIPLERVPAGPAPLSDEALSECLDARARRPFDLSVGPLIRATLFELTKEDHVLLLVIHHAVIDGWSLSLLFSDLMAAYHKGIEGAEPAWEPLRIQYADYSVWQRAWMAGERLSASVAFWKEHLRGAPPETDLPRDSVAPPSGPSSVARRRYTLPAQVRESAVQLAHAEGSTLFTTLLAALNLALFKWSGQKDLVTGTVVAGRNRSELENLLGCFMNFIPIRVKVNEQSTVRYYLKQVRQVVLESQSQQECPFEKIVEAINPDRKQDQNPLYNVALLLQNFPHETFSSEGVQARPFPVFANDPLLDLRLEFEDTHAGLELNCEYKPSLFSEPTIKAFTDSLETILKQLGEKPDALVDSIGIAPALAEQAKAARQLTRKQRIQVVSNFTAEPVEQPLSYWLGELELRAEVHFASYNQIFQELLDPASAFSRNTHGLNVCLIRLDDWAKTSKEQRPENQGRENIRRTLGEFVEALKTAAHRSTVPWLAVFTKGSPVWLQKPGNSRFADEAEATIAQEFERTANVHVVTSAQISALYPVTDYADAAGDELGHMPYTPAYFSAVATVIARKLHTLHRAPCKAIILDCDNTLWGGVCGEDGPEGIRVEGPYRTMQEALVRQHAAGRLLCLCSKNNPEDVEAVFAKRQDMPLKREHITAMRLNWEPKFENMKSLAAELNLGMDSFVFIDDNPVECAGVEANCPQVLTLQLPENTAQIEPFLRHCWALDVTKVTAEDRTRAESYKQNAERAALLSKAPSLADFIASLNLSISIAEAATEDLPRVAQLTQRTNQFNCTTLRRSEGEIRALPHGRRILAVRVNDRFGDYGLVGAVIAQSTRDTLDVETFLLSCRVLGRGVEHRILAHLGEMALQQKLKWVDAHFVKSAKNKPALDFLESIGAGFKQAQNGGYLYRFPAGYAAEVTLNPAEAEPIPMQGEAKTTPTSNDTAANAKFTKCREIALASADFASLHARIVAKERRTTSSTDYIAPQTELQKLVCKTWEKVLNVDRVGIKDNFFALGGHSLLAVRLFAELEKVTGKKLPLITLFQAATVEQLALELAPPKPHEAESLLVPIQRLGNRPPLFLVHGAGGDVLWGYANLATHLGDDQPVYGIKSRAHLTGGESDTLEEMARTYVQQVRSVQSEGPYYLGGYCFGGNVAYEMARQLRAAGQEVAIVALLDSAPTNAGYETVTWWRPSFLPRFARNISYWLDDFRKLETAQKRRFVTRKTKSALRKLLQKVRRGSSAGGETVDLDEVIDVTHFPENELKMWQSHLQALVSHTDRPYDGRVALLRTRGQPLLCSLEPDFCWKRLSPQLEVALVPGSHEQVFIEPHVKELAGKLRQMLDAAQIQSESRSQSKKAA